jgi:hypothetical protein
MRLMKKRKDDAEVFKTSVYMNLKDYSELLVTIKRNHSNFTRWINSKIKEQLEKWNLETPIKSLDGE